MTTWEIILVSWFCSLVTTCAINIASHSSGFVGTRATKATSGVTNSHVLPPRETYSKSTPPTKLIE